MGAYDPSINSSNRSSHNDWQGIIFILLVFLVVCVIAGYFGSGKNISSPNSSGYYDDPGYGDPAIPFN